MRVTIAEPTTDVVRDVELFDNAQVPVGDFVASVLDTSVGDRVVVDGRAIWANATLAEAGAVAGSTLIPENQPADTAPSRPGAARVSMVTGDDAGRSVELPPGQFCIEPRTDCGFGAAGFELTGPLDRAQEVEVTVDGAVLSNGEVSPAFGVGIDTFHAGPSLGERPARMGAPDNQGKRIVNRTRRQQRPWMGQPITPPKVPDEPRPGSRLPLLMLLAPLVFAGVMVFLFKNPAMVIFAVMSPIMILGRWVEEKRSGRSTRKERVKALAEGRVELAIAIDAQRQDWFSHAWTAVDVPAVVEQRAEQRTARLWERTHHDYDYLHLLLGAGSLPFHPRFEKGAALGELSDLAIGQLADHAPVTIDLADRGGFGIVGGLEWCTGFMRWLVAAATVAHGPSELGLTLLTNSSRIPEWDHLKWLPHAAGPGKARIAASIDEANELLAGLKVVKERFATSFGQDEAKPLHLVVVDDPEYLTARTSELRQLVADPETPIRLIVRANRVEDLPASCSVWVEQGRKPVDLDNGADIKAVIDNAHLSTTDHVTDTMTDGERHPMSACRISPARALRIAKSLACCLDGADTDESALPSLAMLGELLDLGDEPKAAVRHRWDAAGPSPSLPFVVGTGRHGPVELDLVEDGPHALVAGTTGAGKSELLRTMVTSLAATVDPDHVNFVLIDFKGGGAFDVCADLPHTVAVVTDLDDHLAERALRCLTAETRYREIRLRDLGASDLAEYQRVAGPGDTTLPRLVVVIDEFAALASELPDFLQSLVDIAQRGRSLGIHLVLATQRPSGVVDNKIKANTNMRIALRVQDDGDSQDVIGTPDAARLKRNEPGRGFVRLGAGEVIAVQTALSSVGALRSANGGAGRVEPFVAHPVLRPPKQAGDQQAEREQPDTELISDIAASLAAERGMADQRRPWPDPLPELLHAPPLVEQANAAVVGVVDYPDDQEQRIRTWRPESGHVLAIGAAGSGTSTLLTTLVAGIATRYGPSAAHIYVLDLDGGSLAPVADLSPVGAYVTVDQHERLQRLFGRFSAEFDRRRKLIAAHPGARWQPGETIGGERLPIMMLAVDNAGVLKELGEQPGPMQEAVAAFARLVRDGAALGLFVAATARNERALPMQLATMFPQRLLFEQADPNAFASFGFRPKDLPEFTPGRALDPAERVEVQTAVFGHKDLVDLAAELSKAERDPKLGPLPIESLASSVPVDVTSLARNQRSGPGIELALGIGFTTLEPVSLQLAPGDHAVVVGETRSGKSSALLTMGLGARSNPATEVTWLALRYGSLADRLPPEADVVTDADDIPTVLDRVADRDRPQLIVIDDVDSVEQADAALASMIAARHPHVSIVVSGSREDFGRYNSWTKSLLRSRQGLLLCPDPQSGDLFRLRLPLRTGDSITEPGRGFVVGGSNLELVQTYLHTPLPERAIAENRPPEAPVHPLSKDPAPTAA